VKYSAVIISILSVLSIVIIVLTLKQKDDFKEAVDLKMSYRIEGSYMHFKYVQVTLKKGGKGVVSYKLYKEYVPKGAEPSEQSVDFEAGEEQVKALFSLYSKMNFFQMKIVDLNEKEIKVTDTGKTTLYISYNGKERELSYGYVENPMLDKLVKTYWDIMKVYLPDTGKNY
jgi:hypothetical protein